MCKISVVIATWRRPHLLRKCLDALRQQDLSQHDYEVLVVSDGPDEMTAKEMIAWANTFCHFTYLQMPVKKGPAAARNAGWKKARGKLIAFTDDDTIPDSHWLSSFWNAYQQEPLIAYSGKVIVPLPARPTDYEKNTAGLENAEFVTANCCCTRSALEKVNGFDERFTTAWREDSDLQFKLINNGIPIISLPGAIVEHPVRLASWGVSLREQKKGVFNALLYKKYPGLYRKKIQQRPTWNYYLMVIAGLMSVMAFIIDSQWLKIFSVSCWLVLLIPFIYKRLRNTSSSPGHVLEMTVTSVFIPFLSVYWQLYGSFKYRVFFL